MGKFFLTFSILFVSSLSFGQEKQKKNELSLSILKASTKAFYGYSDEPLMLNLGVNIIYKRRIYDNFYFRASQSYYSYSLSDYGYYCFDCAANEKNTQEINTSSGLEFRYFITKTGKFVLHSGFDASLFIHQNKKEISLVRAFGSESSMYKQRNTGLGIQGFSGLSIYPTKKLVFSLEGSLLIGFYKQKNSPVDSQSSSEDFGLQPYAQLFLLRTASIGWRF